MDNAKPLALIAFTLRAAELAVFAKPPMIVLHGAVSRALNADIHAEPVKSFSLAPLRRERDGRLVGREIPAGERVQARIGTLKTSTTTAVLAALVARLVREERLNLDGQWFDVEAVEIGEGPLPGVPSRMTHEQLHEMMRPHREIVLRFVSPTAFRQGSAVPAPLPLHPDLVFGGYLRRWREMTGASLFRDGDPPLGEAIALAEPPRVSVARVDLAHLAKDGWLGTARYRVEGDEAYRKRVACLAAFAGYSGTGARTPYGMGQTVPIFL